MLIRSFYKKILSNLRFAVQSCIFAVAMLIHRIALPLLYQAFLCVAVALRSKAVPLNAFARPCGALPLLIFSGQSHAAAMPTTAFPCRRGALPRLALPLLGHAIHCLC
jgi:hypothetical protein